MKKIKFLAIVLSLMMSVSFFSCAPSNSGDGEEIDNTKTQIWISHYNGGVGHAWFEPLKKRFEEEYKDYVIGDKKGVQVMRYDHKDKGSAEINNVKDSSFDIYLSDGFDYYEGYSRGLFLDITDVISDINSDGKTIVDKLNSDQENYFNIENKYYAIPHYAYYGGLNYNVKLFEDKLLYFKDGGGFIDSLSDTRAAGPDGKKGTYDDGLPATYDEFFYLCDEMVSQNIIPFTWSGNYGKAYFNSLLARLMANYEGREQMMLNFTYEGEATHLVDSIDANGNITLKDKTDIGLENGGDIYSTAGRYYALKFAERLFSNKSYYDVNNVENSTDSHTDAQTRYILSSYSKKAKDKPIAFLVDGTYWENEAYDVGAYNTLNNVYKVSREDTRFAYMPMPKVDKTHIGEKEVMIENGSALAFINANVTKRCPEKIDLVKEFFKFMHTDESLVEFAVTTNSFKALSYDVSPAEENNLSYYTRTVLNVRRNSDIVFPNDGNSVFVRKRSSLSINNTFTTNNYQFAMNFFMDNAGNTSGKAKEYFNDLVPYLKNQWSK